MDPEQVGAWVLAELPRLNRAILGEGAAPALLVDELDDQVLGCLPEIDRIPPEQARQLVVLLGLAGASVARHYQEHTPGGTECPEQAFDPLTVGAGEVPFRAYFTALAEHTGTGHYERDSYASLVRWNVGGVRVSLGDEVLAELPGIFEDGRIRSYTGTPGERSFFLLIKQGEAIERAVNDLLAPLALDGVNRFGEEARRRVRESTVLLAALRRLLVDFAGLPPEQAMPPETFMDVFRQFAAHWTTGDIPPSGALDPEALKRDFLLGLPMDGYARHTRRLFPALLDAERTALDELMDAPTLPERLLAEIGTDERELRLAGVGELRQQVGRHPALADWYRLLAMHARVSGAHLMLSKRFLFKPQRLRDAAGLGDKLLVSNRAGTTGMTETFLERLTRARQDHSLIALRPALIGENAHDADDAAVVSGREAASSVVVEMTG